MLCITCITRNSFFDKRYKGRDIIEKHNNIILQNHGRIVTLRRNCKPGLESFTKLLKNIYFHI